MLKSTETKAQACKVCQKPLVREAQGPSTQLMETLDNGLMPKAVTRLVDIERLVEAQVKDDPRFAHEPDNGEVP